MQPETANISIDDQILVEQCRNNDPDALERLIIRYKDRIYNVILRICANPDDAAELTQDTFVKIIENLDRFEGRSSFYTWAFRIAVNLTLNYCKRNIRQQNVSLDAATEDYSRAKRSLKEYLADDNVLDPQAITQNREQQRLIIEALNKLDDAHRTIIILRDIEGMDYTRIAHILDIELGTVKSRLSRARANLREILESVLQ